MDKLGWLWLPFGLSVNLDVFTENRYSHQGGARCHMHNRVLAKGDSETKYDISPQSP